MARACPEVQGGAHSAQSLQPIRHRQVPDRRGLVPCQEAAATAERTYRGHGKRRKREEKERGRVREDSQGAKNT